jgi:hypothetical protein
MQSKMSHKKKDLKSILLPASLVADGGEEK